MKTEPLALFYATLVFLLAGTVLGAWNDLGYFLFCILLNLKTMKERTKQRIRKISQIFSDIFFCLLAGISAMVLLFYFNGGKTRGFAFLAMVIGFLLYRCTAGRLFGKVKARLSRRIGRALNRTVFYLTLPLYKLFVWAFHTVSLPIAACRKRYRRHRMMRYDTVCRQTLNEKSKKGFVNI